jgi:homoaconitase/3-isopropylmalate dehydratase large subunit
MKKKIPTKADLTQLQKLYKTDEKIGERLGGVPAYLVAYWRRKKNVPKHSLPKFSEREIMALWERFGDDDKCGLELGISKAAFYNWRRKYGIREKPDFLKLEQLELSFPGLKVHGGAGTLLGQRTIVRKILCGAAGVDPEVVSHSVHLEPSLTIVDDALEQVVDVFKGHGTELVWNPNKIICSLGKSIFSDNECSAKSRKKLNEFVRRQGLKHALDHRAGASWQNAVEAGLVYPGQCAVGSSVDSSCAGALGAYVHTVDATQMGLVWTKGKLDVTIPNTIRVDINGRVPKAVSATDIAFAVSKLLGGQQVAGRVIEYYGSVVSHMEIAERLTLVSHAPLMEAVGAICGFDSITRRFLAGRTSHQFVPQIADKDAAYDGVYTVNVDQLAPEAMALGKRKGIKLVADIEDLSVQVVVAGLSCGGIEDLRLMAEIIRTKQVHSDCRMYVLPATRSVYLEALRKGLIRVFVECGAVVIAPGTEGAIAPLSKLLNPGERCLITAGAEILGLKHLEELDLYLCSPATAVTSAINGRITDPTRYVK